MWRPLREQGVGLTSMMIVSIGVGLAARYLYLYTFGGRSRAYREYAVQSALDIGPFSLTKRDLVSMAICVIVLLAVALLPPAQPAGQGDPRGLRQPRAGVGHRHQHRTG